MRRMFVRAAAMVTVLMSVVVAGSGPTLARRASYAATSAEQVRTVDQRAVARRLVIPAIGVDAGILAVGVRGGHLAIGTSVRSVYRWRMGVLAGQPGSSVFAGHTWSKGPGVFDRLGELRPGNKISVGTVRFQVTRVRRVTRMASDDVRGLFSDRGKPRLVLITCGDRNNLTGVYRSRIIVNARLVPQRHRLVVD